MGENIAQEIQRQCGERMHLVRVVLHMQVMKRMTKSELRAHIERCENFAATPVFVVTKAEAAEARRRSDFVPVESYPPGVVPLRTEIGFVRDQRLVLALPKWAPPPAAPTT